MPGKDNALAAVHASIEAYCTSQHDFGFDPKSPVVRLHEPTFGADEINAAVDCLLSTRVTMGPKVRAFEAEFAAHYGWQHAVMVNSGSSANLLAVAAVANPLTSGALRPGDEVIVPALSWSTTVWPLVQLGLTPVIVDIDPHTFNIDSEQIARAIGPRTRAVMIVPVYGNPCDMTAITELCRRHELMLIEDCCEALDASYGGAPVGKFGRVGTFSFYYSHHITTLEGGMCVTDDFELAETMRILRAHGWVREVQDKQSWLERYPEIDPKFLFVNLGYNLRATELQGAMGSIQLPKLRGFVETRRSNHAWFSSALGQLGDFFDFQQEQPGGRSSTFGFAVRLRPHAPFALQELTDALEQKGIETRPIICGNIALQPAMQLFPHRVVGDLRHATEVMRRAFSFGNHQAIDAAARTHVLDSFRGFLRDRGLI